MNSDIRTPCRLGEWFRMHDPDSEHDACLLSVQADDENVHGSFEACGSVRTLLENDMRRGRTCEGIAPRPWGRYWTCRGAIRITPPAWIWMPAPASQFGLEIPPLRSGRQRLVRLLLVGMNYGAPGYRIAIEHTGVKWLSSIPLLDPYFRDIWPENMTDGVSRYYYFYREDDNGKV